MITLIANGDVDDSFGGEDLYFHHQEDNNTDCERGRRPESEKSLLGRRGEADGEGERSQGRDRPVRSKKGVHYLKPINIKWQSGLAVAIQNDHIPSQRHFKRFSTTKLLSIISAPHLDPGQIISCYPRKAEPSRNCYIPFGHFLFPRFLNLPRVVGHLVPSRCFPFIECTLLVVCQGWTVRIDRRRGDLSNRRWKRRRLRPPESRSVERGRPRTPALGSRRWSFCSMGTMKAAVFPVPVRAMATTSSSERMRGIALHWIGVGNLSGGKRNWTERSTERRRRSRGFG